MKFYFVLSLILVVFQTGVFAQPGEGYTHIKIVDKKGNPILFQEQNNSNKLTVNTNTGIYFPVSNTTKSDDRYGFSTYEGKASSITIEHKNEKMVIEVINYPNYDGSCIVINVIRIKSGKFELDFKKARKKIFKHNFRKTCLYIYPRLRKIQP